jgi:hypothetical protein
MVVADLVIARKVKLSDLIIKRDPYVRGWSAITLIINVLPYSDKVSEESINLFYVLYCYSVLLIIYFPTKRFNVWVIGTV